MKAEVTSSGPAAVSARRRVGRAINAPALGAVLLWSGVAPFAKYALAEFPVLAYTALRPLVAALLLFALLALRGEPLGIARRDWPRLFVAGFGGMAISQLCFIGGLARTSASHGVLLVSTSPLLGATLGWIFRRGAPDRRTLFGIVAGFAGVALLITGAGGAGGASLSGDLLSLLAALAWLLVTILPAPLVVRYGSVRITAWLILAAAIVVVPIGLGGIAETARTPPSALAWLSLLYGTVLGMLVGNALWQRAVEVGGASQTLIYLYLEPVGALILAALLLGERLGPLQALGGALALLGVGLVQRRSAR